MSETVRKIIGPVLAKGVGAWNSATQYKQLQMVLNAKAGGGDGCVYVALAASTNVRPGTDPTKWMKMAECGEDGASAIMTRIDYTAQDTQVTGLAWGTVHVFPEMASLDFTLAAAPSDGYDHHIAIVFDTPADLTNFNLAVPSTIHWGNNINLASNLHASTRYEINISSASMIALYTEAALLTS